MQLTALVTFSPIYLFVSSMNTIASFPPISLFVSSMNTIVSFGNVTTSDQH
jgi:hypothetical protein